MANFQTHLTWAAAGSGLLSVLCLQVGFVDQRDALNLALLGTIGGILPDVDLQRSYPSRILFALLGIFVAFLLVFSVSTNFSILELWLLGIGAFLTIRYPFWYIFHQNTTHRGSIHSMVAGMFAMFSTVAISYHWMDKTPFAAWLLGFFLLLGFLLHLVLDELYSVDFMNYRIKRSFGTALKFIDTRKPYKSTLLVVAALTAWWFTPDSTPFWDTFISPQTYQIIVNRFLPI